MERAERSADAAPVLGIVGADDGTVARLEDVVRDHDASGAPFDAEAADRRGVAAGRAESVLEAGPAFAVAVGEGALLALVRAGVSIPVLPVDCGPGVESVDRAGDAVRIVLAEGADLRSHTTLSVDVDGRADERALFDATLVTEEPARISEYGVRSDDREIARFRADGVAVATAAGSAGYANAAGGPILSPAVDAVAVVPVAPFVTETDRWILPEDVALSVERDEGDVILVVDDRPVETISTDDTVSIAADGSIDVLVTSPGESDA